MKIEIKPLAAVPSVSTNFARRETNLSSSSPSCKRFLDDSNKVIPVPNYKKLHVIQANQSQKKKDKGNPHIISLLSKIWKFSMQQLKNLHVLVLNSVKSSCITLGK